LLPLIPRALALLDPGAAMRRHLPRRRMPDAVPKRPATPVPVGPASAHRGPVDTQVRE
jgi:hypothetical protein